MSGKELALWALIFSYRKAIKDLRAGCVKELFEAVDRAENTFKEKTRVIK